MTVLVIRRADEPSALDVITPDDLRDVGLASGAASVVAAIQSVGDLGSLAEWVTFAARRDGYGYIDDYGCGYGAGDGDGDRYGYGYGDGYGDGGGYGNSDGCGCSYGYGYGAGDGDGHGCGCGRGCGFGYGCGNGRGDGQ